MTNHELSEPAAAGGDPPVAERSTIHALRFTIHALPYRHGPQVASRVAKSSGPMLPSPLAVCHCS